jgi:hypothetical protein
MEIKPLMIKLKYTLLFLLLISVKSFSEDFQYLIFKQYYKHYENVRPSAHGDIFTFLQGPMLEQAVNKNLKSNVKKCKSGINSKYIVSLEPNIFYNYQMTITYGQLNGKIFGANNILIDSFNIELQRQGKIHQKANFYINKMYGELVIKLNDDILNKLPKDASTINGDFCTTIELSKEKQILDVDYKKPIQA